MNVFPIHPQAIVVKGLEPDLTSTAGITNRELYAALAMQGLLASGLEASASPRALAEEAVCYADMLIEALKGDSDSQAVTYSFPA